MVPHRPREEILLSIGAAYRTPPLLTAAERLVPIARADLPQLTPYGIPDFAPDDLSSLIEEVRRLFADKRAKNKDTPLQMAQLIELLASVRAWLRTIRLLASINLACDAPALSRLASSSPELAEGYPRDLLTELERIISAARDLRPRLEDAGLTEAFVGRGARFAQQLRTAIGAKDLDGKDLSIAVRRLYHRKAELYLLEKRIVRAGQLAFMTVSERQTLYHLEELEPAVLEPLAARPPPSSRRG
ncbi:MAG: hypothetical protein IPK13_20795 [Deltaproteobacteria bacterium]|nr:hypothetical protein [Deltaproteobacteria bacterium]